ncbi:MAG: glycosyltransferase family 9 protein [Deltaproteobacteria bacterium]|nr:glycosyltransferase family 9 protein [Deltaproteobacteria bacterium]
MNVKLQRKIDQVIGAILCRVLSLFCFSRQAKTTPRNTRKILVILLSEMGSLVLAHPMFQLLKSRYPKAAISVLQFKENREIMEIMEVVPNENIYTIDPSSPARLFVGIIRVVIELRRQKFDVSIDCELFHRISSMLSYLSGAPVRVGFHRHTQEGLYRGDFINCPVLYNPYQHISQQFITLADAMESETFPRSKRSVAPVKTTLPKVRLTPTVTEAFTRRFHTHAPAVEGKPLVLLYPSGGLLPIRAWPLESYCRLADKLLQAGCAVGIIGMKEDRHLAQTIQAHCRHKDCIDLTGFTRTLRELMILFHLASLLITNDGGPGQFSAMTPIKTIIFFGPETPVLYGPLSDNAVVFHSSLSCSPCLSAYNHRNSPCDGDNVCLTSIGVQQVLAKALDMLNFQPAARGES